MPVSCMGVSVQIPASLLQIQLPATMSGKAVEYGPTPWAPATNMGDLDGIPVS